MLPGPRTRYPEVAQTAFPVNDNDEGNANATCAALESTQGSITREVDDTSQEHEEAQLEELDSDSFDVEDYWLYTFITGTEDGIKRFDNFFREGTSLNDVIELLEMLLRSEVQVQEVLPTNGLAVDKQRVFIAVMERTDETFLSLQRRFHGYEQESFKILRIRGRVDYEIYSKNFVQEHALEVYLGVLSVCSTPLLLMTVNVSQWLISSSNCDPSGQILPL